MVLSEIICYVLAIITIRGLYRELTSASFKLVLEDDKSSTATLTGPSDRTKFFMYLISSSVIQRDSFNYFNDVFMA